MNKKIFEHWINEEPDSDESRYIFLSDNKIMCESIVTVGFRAVYLAPKSGDFFDLNDLKIFLENHMYGFATPDLVYVPCCLRKKTNDSIEDFCKFNGLDVKTSGWSLFREKEYLTKYEYQEELERTLKGYIKRFEGDGEINCTDLQPFHMFNENGNPTGVLDIKIVEYLMDTLTLFVMDQEAYVYRNGVYKRDKDGIYLMSVIQSLIYPKLIKATTITRVYNLLIMQIKLQRSMSEVNAYPAWWINFQNGMLDVRERKMRRHDPKYLCINQIPHNYSPDAVPEHPEDTVIMKFLKMSVPDGQDQMMLFEYIGYCMTRDTGFQKLMMITGEGGTGKSQIIALIQHIVGEENCSPLSIQDLNQRFYPSELYGKLLNACPDIKGGTLEDVSNLKKATGEDILMYERKNKDPSSFRSYAKLLFSANKIPLNMDEKSNAFYRRLLILSMNRVLKEDEKDRELLLKLKRETEYVIYLACTSLAKLYADGKFAESNNSQNQVQELYRAADSVKAFIDECLVESPGNRLDRTPLYEMYKEYCEENGRTAHKSGRFYDSLQDKGYKLGRTREGRYVEGLAVREPEFEQDDGSAPFPKG